GSVAELCRVSRTPRRASGSSAGSLVVAMGRCQASRKRCLAPLLSQRATCDKPMPAAILREWDGPHVRQLQASITSLLAHRQMSSYFATTPTTYALSESCKASLAIARSNALPHAQ